MSGMAGIEDGDAFSDDDFADIPDEELQRLEQDAITFTQQEQTFPKPLGNGPVSTRTQTRPLPAARGSLVATIGKDNGTSQASKYIHDVQPNSSENLIIDEDGLPLDIEEHPQIVVRRLPDETAKREQWRLNRFAAPQVQAQLKTALPARQNIPNYSHPAATNSSVRNGDNRTVPLYQPRGSQLPYRNVEGDGSRATVAELMRERDELVRHLHETKEEILTRRGEVQNLRAKQLEEERTHARKISAIQKLKQEEADKHAALVQSMNAENAKVLSEIQFLKQELKEESRKTQGYQRQLKERPLVDKPNNVNTTPKRGHAIRDGFDDDDLVMISPVKSGRKSKQSTPTANRKRKQPAGGADVYAHPLTLRLSGVNAEPKPQAAVAGAKADKSEATIRKDLVSLQNLRLVQNITNFRPNGSHETLIQQLFRLSYPSDTGQNLGSRVLDSISKLGGQRLPGDLIQVFIDLWSKALKEGYYVCLMLLIEAVSYILDQDVFVVDVILLNNLLPLLRNTIDINAQARFWLMKKEYLTDPTKPKPVVNQYISNTSCLDLMHTVACLIADDIELISLFWRSGPTDFPLLMLSASQTIPDIILTLRLLATSILPETFSMICDASTQNQYETYVIKSVCYLFLPRPDVDDPPSSEKQICLLRQESLDLLTTLTLGSAPNAFNPNTATNHGTAILVHHPSAIARLVRCAYDELASAYRMTPNQSLHIQLVNTAVRILHFLFLSPATRQVSWHNKITAMNGGAHKFRVVMARLAYAHGTSPGIDAGITAETSRMATEMLDESITPDEVDDLVQVFESEGGNSSRRTSAIGSTQR